MIASQSLFYYLSYKFLTSEEEAAKLIFPAACATMVIVIMAGLYDAVNLHVVGAEKR